MKKTLTIIAAALLALLLLAGIGSCTYRTSIKETHRGPCTVIDKDRTSKPKGGSDMRIYTDQCGNFSVSDALLKLKFNSSDTYAGLEVGHTYELTTTGYRAGFLSAFPNIIAAEEVAR